MHVSVRLVQQTDAEVLSDLQQRNREALAPWDPVRPDHFYSVEGQRAFLADALAQHARGAAFPGVILVDDVPAGRVNLNNVVLGYLRSTDLGYWVDQDHRGAGVATAAVGQLLRVAFDELGLHRVAASTLLHNRASRRVLAHHGFTEIGVAPRYVKIAGRWQDHLLHQLLADEV